MSLASAAAARLAAGGGCNLGQWLTACAAYPAAASVKCSSFG